MKEHKESTNTNNDENSTEENNEFEEYIKNLDANLAMLEKLGLFFILSGYSLFVYGANLDILESLDIETNSSEPDFVTFTGQQLVLTGYIILFVVASKRVYEKSLRIENQIELFELSSYRLIANAYLLSVIANAMRVQGFSQIVYFIDTLTIPSHSEE